jgi:hypothetical protein
MPTSGGLTSDEANSAAWEAGRGAVAGAVKVRTSSRWGDIWTNRRQWGAGAAILGAAGYVMSPIYRGLTIQFKV